MLVERTDKEIIIRIPATVNFEDLQDFLNYSRYKELTSGFKVSQDEVDQLASDINKGWWSANRHRFVKK